MLCIEQGPSVSQRSERREKPCLFDEALCGVYTMILLLYADDLGVELSVTCSALGAK